MVRAGGVQKLGWHGDGRCVGWALMSRLLTAEEMNIIDHQQIEIAHFAAEEIELVISQGR